MWATKIPDICGFIFIRCWPTSPLCLKVLFNIEHFRNDPCIHKICWRIFLSYQNFVGHPFVSHIEDPISLWTSDAFHFCVEWLKWPMWCFSAISREDVANNFSWIWTIPLQSLIGLLQSLIRLLQCGLTLQLQANCRKMSLIHGKWNYSSTSVKVIDWDVRRSYRSAFCS